MQIYGPYRLNASQGLQANNRISPARSPEISAAKASASPIDQLDLSPAARVSSTSETSGPATVGGDMRLDKIADIRRQIANGNYDTPEKFEQAFSRMLDDFA